MNDSISCWTKSLKNQQHRSVPLKDSITKIGKGYPDKLVIFQIPASSFWYVRYFHNNKIIKRSTKTSSKQEAIKFAKQFYESLLVRLHAFEPLTNSSGFEKCANELLKEQEHLIKSEQRNKKLNLNDKNKLDKDMLEFFKGYDISDIKYKHINNYVSHLSDKKLKVTTIKVYLVLLRKIFNYALREGLIDSIPVFPKLKLKDSPRGWFSTEEYSKLRKTTKELIKQNVKVRYHQITDEMRMLITFMVNTFLRPSDLKELRHRHIAVVNTNNEKFLRIQTETSKTANYPIVSMRVAVDIYQKLIEFHQRNNSPSKKDDFVFYPNITNRNFAMSMMGRMFDEILDKADLKHAPDGQPRTLYSLRHTAIMFRMIKGDNIDLLTLARNARTSVTMIDRFYAKHLLPEMNLDKIQSIRTKTKTNNKKKTETIVEKASDK